ncbi:thioredoxin TrxC [Rhodopseudomonas sp. HC1]|uniref:thioredoxin TrxC n=1 Tax=Rhodopseudomonas infernalis TaxID=2897386 RepID=UPI001EE99AD9|nr:thioredoxin TrxC [Rhodopseudomonas infernalis]MCG6206437.1 thioredoxin TrxC [Rhodopseudomonas infernalis]
MSDRLVVCTQCGGVNRLPEQRQALQAKCGSCGAKLFDGHPADVGGDIFDKQISRSSVPVVVDVWAPWCGPCRAMAPAYEIAARDLEPNVRLIKLNSDTEQQIAARLGVSGIPTMILFANGRERARTSGAMPPQQIVRWVREHLPA